MKPENILAPPPFTMNEGVTMRQPKFSQAAKDFQDSLLRTGPDSAGMCINGHDRDKHTDINTRGHKFCRLCQKIALKVKKDKAIRAERGRERYKALTREEKDKRNAADRKSYKDRKANK